MVYQLFGHIHSGKGQTGLDMPRMNLLFPTQYDVGMDNNNYTPLSWKEVNEKIQTRYDSKYAQTKDYLLEEAKLIEASKVETDGNYVWMFISADADKMNEIFQGTAA